MSMTRRAFMVGSSIVAVAGSTVGISGCSAGSVFSSILSWVTVAGPKALSAIQTILKAAGITFSPQLTSIIGLIFTGFTDLANAVAEYQSTTPPPVGALAKIDTVLLDLMDNFQGLLVAIPGVGPIVAVALAIAEVVISTIGGFISALPASIASNLPKSTARLKAPFRRGTGAISVVPVKRTNRQFALDVNTPITNAAKSGVITSLTAKEAKLPVPLFG